jgi:hypothetical protein
MRCWGSDRDGLLGNPDVTEDIGDDEPASAAPEVPIFF